MTLFITFLPIVLAIDKGDMPEKRAIDGAVTKSNQKDRYMRIHADHKSYTFAEAIYSPKAATHANKHTKASTRANIV